MKPKSVFMKITMAVNILIILIYYVLLLVVF